MVRQSAARCSSNQCVGTNAGASRSDRRQNPAGSDREPSVALLLWSWRMRQSGAWFPRLVSSLATDRLDEKRSGLHDLLVGRRNFRCRGRVSSAPFGLASGRCRFGYNHWWDTIAVVGGELVEQILDRSR